MVELLAPGGERDSIKAAILGGAGAVYCGLGRFNARNRAANISLEELFGLIRLAHRHNCQIFLTMNIVLFDNEFQAVVALLNKLVNSGIDAVIVQDLGLFYLLKHHFPTLNVHASTQNTFHNRGQIGFLKQLCASRVNFSRELNLTEIGDLAQQCRDAEIETEVFVHGSNCISFSGICYMSSQMSDTSGNRGRCSQPCRDQFETTEAGNSFPFNMKDNNACNDLEKLLNCGVDSLKIEGRIKKFHYVYSVVNEYHKQLERLQQGKEVLESSVLPKLFNRDFTTGYIDGTVGSSMFIDSPMDGSAELLAQAENIDIETAKKRIYDYRTDIIQPLREKVEELDDSMPNVTIAVSGSVGDVLQLSVVYEGETKQFFSKSELIPNSEKPLTGELLLKNFKGIGECGVKIVEINSDDLDSNSAVPLKELTELKREIISWINGGAEYVKPVELPKLKSSARNCEPVHSLVIDRESQIPLAENFVGERFFRLPDSLEGTLEHYVELFRKNPSLIPFFSSLLIGNDFELALKFLDRVNLSRIATDNSGIAFEAFHRNIEWIAGTSLNITNSWSVKAVHHEFNCVGVMLSHELTNKQIAALKKPEGMKLYRSISHEQVAMTMRQCLFQTVTGCEKSCVDEWCIPNCEKSADVVHEKGETFRIVKRPGSYQRVINRSPVSMESPIVPAGVDSLVTDLSWKE